MKLSIVTIIYNNKKGLAKTIESVVNQEFKDFEWIVIDGGSTDGSKELIQDNLTHIDYWLSEKDQGIYDAMNKGIKASTRDYILFLNSGDFFITNNAVKLITNAPNIEDLIFCDIQIRSKKEVYQQINSSNPKQILLDRMICHQAILHKRSLFTHVGLYSLDYKITSDYEFLIKSIYKYNCTYSYFPYCFVEYDDTNGISDFDSNGSQLKQERLSILKNYFSESLVHKVAQQESKIDTLLKIKYAHDGLLKSNIIKCALWLITFKKLFKIKRDK